MEQVDLEKQNITPSVSFTPNHETAQTPFARTRRDTIDISSFPSVNQAAAENVMQVLFEEVESEPTKRAFDRKMAFTIVGVPLLLLLIIISLILILISSLGLDRPFFVKPVHIPFTDLKCQVTKTQDTDEHVCRMTSVKEATARKNEQLLMDLLKIDANKYCADCGQKGTRWASWNLGVFLCIRCGGLHRKLGTHISRVKSVNLDKWTDEQVENMVNNGNAKANATYNPNADRFPFPSYSGDMEQYIRDKYERKLFMSSGSTRSPPPPASSNYSRKNSISNSSAGGDHRYPLQMKSLQEMGFNDTEANQAALLTTSGNLQQAIETLLAGKTGRLNLNTNGNNDITGNKNANFKSSSSAADDLADIFGTVSAPPPPPSSSNFSTTATYSASKNTSNSILDMDLPLSTSKDEIQRTNEASSDEFEDFETAVEPTRRGSTTNELDSNKTLGTKSLPQVKNFPQMDAALSNPWASNNNNSNANSNSNTSNQNGNGKSGGDAFDDIDPFRGFTPTNRS